MKNISNSKKHTEVLSLIEQRQYVNEESKQLLTDLYKLLSTTSHQVFWYNFTNAGFTAKMYEDWCKLEQRLSEYRQELYEDYPDTICYAIKQFSKLYKDILKELGDIYDAVAVDGNEISVKRNPYREKVMNLIMSINDTLSEVSNSLRYKMGKAFNDMPKATPMPKVTPPTDFEPMPNVEAMLLGELTQDQKRGIIGAIREFISEMTEKDKRPHNIEAGVYAALRRNNLVEANVSRFHNKGYSKDVVSTMSRESVNTAISRDSYPKETAELKEKLKKILKQPTI